MRSTDELLTMPHLRVMKVGQDGGCGAIWFEKVCMTVIWSFGGGWCPNHTTPREAHERRERLMQAWREGVLT